MTKAVLAATDRQLAVTHIFLRLDLGVPPRCLLRQADTLNTFFVSGGIWDTTAMLAKTERPFVMTNAMLARTGRQAEPSKLFDYLRCNSLNLHIALNAIIVVGIFGVEQIRLLVGKIGYRFEERFRSINKDNCIITVPTSILLSHDDKITIVNSDARH